MRIERYKLNFQKAKESVKPPFKARPSENSNRQQMKEFLNKMKKAKIQ